MASAQRRVLIFVALFATTAIAAGALVTWLSLRFDLSSSISVGLAVLAVIGALLLTTSILMRTFRD